MIIELNHELLGRLTETEQKIAKYINEHENELSQMSIVDIAFSTFTSPSTISRTIRKCGIKGFNELRYRLMQPSEDKSMVSLSEIMNKSLIEAEKLLEMISLRDVLKVVKRIQAAKRDNHRVYVFARGLTSYVAKEFSLKLSLLGYNVLETDDPNIMKSVTRHIDSNNLAIIFSLNGTTKELVESAANASACGCDVITCCCSDESPLLGYSTQFLTGFKHKHISIQEYEVTSRVSLSIMSRIIIDYLVEQSKE